MTTTHDTAHAELERHARIDRLEQRIAQVAAEVAEATAIVAQLTAEHGTSTNADTGR